MGITSGYLDDAEDLLTIARKDKEKGYPAAALFEAIESLSNANLDAAAAITVILKPR